MSRPGPALPDPPRDTAVDGAVRVDALDAVLTRAPVMVFALDTEGTCTFSDGAGLAGIGLRPGQVVGHNMFEMYADEPAVLENMRRALDGEAFRSEYYRTDGPCFDTWWLPTGEDGQVTGAIGVSLDVTERVRAREQVELFRALVEAAPQFIAIAGLDGRVQYVNPGGRAMTGMPDDVDITATTIADYLTPEGLLASEQVEQPAVLAHGHYEGETTLKHWPTGSGIPVQVASFLVRDLVTGEPSALATVQSDIGEVIEARRTMEQALAHQRGLLLHLNEAYEAERRRVAAEMHDDPVQVLAAVNLRIAGLRRQLEGEGDVEAALASAAALDDAVRSASGRLRSLLFQLDPPPVIEVGLDELLRQHAAQILSPSTTWTVSSDMQRQPTELAGRVLLRIAGEALVNVRKHANASSVTIDLAEDGGTFSLRVRDDGVGFTPAAAEPFRHLGLRSMSDRAESAGGWLKVTSSPGEGTVVEAGLPARLGFPHADAPVPDLRTFLEQTLESIPDAYVAIDRDWRYVYMNSAGYALFERDQADSVVGKRVWDEFDVAPEFEQAYRRARAEQVPLTVRGYYAPWGKWLENRIFPTSSGLSIFARDVTEEVRVTTEAEVQFRLIESGRSVVNILATEPDDLHALRGAARAVVDGWGLVGLRLHVDRGAWGESFEIAVGDAPEGASRDVFPLVFAGVPLGKVELFGDAGAIDPDLWGLFALRIRSTPPQ